MNLSRALRLMPHPPLRGASVGVAGAGGKTTAIFQLARELTPPVLISSTTHFGDWQVPLADRHIIATSAGQVGEIGAGVTLVSGPVENERTAPVHAEVLRFLQNLAQSKNVPLLLECDGSRGLPLKAPADHEPPIPDFVDTVVVVAGLHGLGQRLDESHVHRPHLFSALSGLALGAEATPEGLTRVLLHPEGGLKNIPAGARRVCLLNQADTPDLQAIAQQMSQRLLESYDSVVIANLKDKTIHAVHEKVAGIILAAGESTRFGKPKQLLDWHGEPFVRAVARKALAAGLSPVAVVTGSNAAAVEAAVRDLDVIIVHNSNWQSGQSSSIVAGVKEITPSLPPPNPPQKERLLKEPRAADLGEMPFRAEGVGAGIFLLADQPQVTVEVMRALVESHRREMPAIVAPLILEERRGNPVLFDRVTFADLLTLRGDVGGRAIFHKHKVEFLPWHDDALLLDVDTPEDYQRLIESA